MTHPIFTRACRCAFAWACGLALAALLCSAAQAQGKQRIEKAADLPRFTYPVSGKLEALVRDEAAFGAFATQLRRDTETVLRDYEITDKAMQRQLQGTLLQLDVLESRDAAALARIEVMRSLEEKPADKLLAGLQVRAMIDARQAAGETTSQRYRDEVGRHLSEALGALPYAVIANDIREAKARAEFVGEALVLGNLRNVLQPIVDQGGSLSSELAPGVISARFALTLRLPLKQTLIDTYGAYLARNRVDKPDLWKARQVALPAGRNFTPVRIGVWDSGVDSALFKQQVLRDVRGQPLLNAFDKYGKPSSTELQMLPAAMLAELPKMRSRTKGFSDMEANIDSAQASELKQFLSNLKAEDYKSAIEEINLAGNYEHGTHVAGIALDGNPYARLLITRIEFGHTLAPDPCPSRAQADKDAQALAAQIQFLKFHKARVVNMSWGGSVRAIEKELEQCRPGGTIDERKALARELFNKMRDTLQRGFAGAPQVLWITAAGNSNEDATFAEDAPADIVLPNLLTVGAVDQAGDEASFTSYGPTVKVHANGYLVDSFIPGGDRVALSGTSMAAPQVANLAGKMLAVNPRLSPPQVIALIVATADKTADGRRTLVNPARALAKAGLRQAR